MSYVNMIRMFVRVYELGSMSAAARRQRLASWNNALRRTLLPQD